MSTGRIRFLRLSLELGVTTLMAILIVGVIILSNLDISSSYTPMDVGRLVSDYMRTHNNEWPRDWDQLQAQYDENPKKYSNIHSMDTVKKEFDIDFTIDAQKYIENHNLLTNFSPVRYRAGSHAHVSGLEANDIIRGYLQSVQ